jgi:hypothetical protein
VTEELVGAVEEMDDQGAICDGAARRGVWRSLLRST